MDDQRFQELLRRPESETLDFKARDYDLRNIEKRLDLIKDVLAMANTPREDPESFLVLGVKRDKDGSTQLLGLSQFEDEADLQSQFSERVHPVPRFAYYTFPAAGKTVGVIAISRDLRGPFTLSRNFGSMAKGQIYFRRGSKNEVATGEDIRRITDWFKSQGSGQPSFRRRVEAWAPFLDAVGGFDARRRFVLVASPIRDAKADRVEALSHVPWMSVLDFDPDSENGGLLGRVKDGITAQRSVHLTVKGDAVSPTSRSTVWFFARGLRGRHETVQEGPYKEWFRAYSAEIDRQMSKAAAGISPFPVTVVGLWYEPGLGEHLRRVLDSVITKFQDAANIVIATSREEAIRPVVDPLGVPAIEIALHDLCAGIEAHYQRNAAEVKTFRFPGTTDAGALIDQEKARWLQEDLDLADIEAGHLSTDTDPRREFLIGQEITWGALALHADVDRELGRKLLAEVERKLEERRTVRINLYHAPGAGGTTVGKRVTWDLREKYPAAILLRCLPSDTARRLYYLTSETGLPVLLMVDSAQVSERQIDDLFTELRAQQIPVVLLQILRRFGPPQGARHYLPTDLSKNEAARFFHAFAQAAPFRRTQLELIVDSANAKERSPFFFGLTAYGKDFQGLASYVRRRLESVGPDLHRIAVFMAIAHRYAQRELPGPVFADLLGIPRNRPVDVRSLLPVDFQELFVEGREGMWRTAHELIATEILEQVLGRGSTDPQAWMQNLSVWATEFAHLCRGDQQATPGDEMLEIARRTFIYRDNTDLLGTERSGTNNFAQLIEDIRVKEGCLQVLKEVVSLFPDEAHFWAHLGRFYAYRMNDYAEALQCNDRAIALQGDDHVLHHMRAMTLRKSIYSRIDDRVPLGDFLDDVKTACTYFQDARALNPQDEHSYISEVQMVIRVLDYASQNKDLATLLQAHPDPFLREAIDRCETLLDTVRRNREGEGSSNYERDCRAKLDSIYGQYGRALQTWTNLLQRRDLYAPPVRRQIVWTLLRRAQRWEAMPPRDVDRTVDLLEDNLDAEPNNERDLRLWIQAVRKCSRPPSIDAVIERVVYWKTNSGSLEATYYLYLLNALKALNGSAFAREDCLRFVDESRQLARARRNRTRSFEWLGSAEPTLAQLVSHAGLGEWDEQRNFWRNTEGLARVAGRIAKIDAPQAGLIETPGGLTAFFVPAVGNFTEQNIRVECFLGFSYDGIRAWEVKRPGS